MGKKTVIKQQVKIEITPGTVYEIKPNAKYLLIFNRRDIDKGDLSGIDQALKGFFDGQVLAIFADQMTNVKIAELLENK